LGGIAYVGVTLLRSPLWAVRALRGPLHLEGRAIVRGVLLLLDILRRGVRRLRGLGASP
jgi:hypothetical protein